MGAPEIPDFNQYRFKRNETTEVIVKHNLQMAALNTFAEGLVDYVKEQGEALLVAGGAIFPTTAAGMAEASNDGYFFAENPDPNISKTLYQRLSETEYRKVADDPSTEFVNGIAAAQYAAIELASQIYRSEFYTSDDDELLYGILDKNGKTLSGWDREGYQLAPVRKDFHTSDDPTFFAITDKNRVPLMAVDENRQPIIPLIRDFFTSDDQPAFATVDKNGVVFYGLDPQGRVMVGGEGLSVLASSERSATDGTLYLQFDEVKKKRDYSSPFFNQLPMEALPDLAAWYQYYDDLMSDNLDYIERVTLDTDGLGNPIYAYIFSPPPLRTSVSYPIPESSTPLPSIVIVSGTHGVERTGAFVSLQLAHDLCNDWQSNSLARLLRFGVRVIFVPCLVPSGCDANLRKNHNGVDINRNFPVEWGATGSTDPADDMYIGPSAGSEIETQVGMSLPDLYPNAFLYIDLHNHTRLDVSGFASWVGARGARERAILGKVGRDITGFIRGEYPYLTNDIQTPINQVSNSGGGFMATYWSAEKNVPGIYFESVTSLSDQFGPFRQDALRFNYENFSLTIRAFYEQHLSDTIGGL